MSAAIRSGERSVTTRHGEATVAVPRDVSRDELSTLLKRYLESAERRV